MPYRYDWSDKTYVKELEVNNIPGWKDVTIEYMYKLFMPGKPDVYWRIKDVDHTWVITNEDMIKYMGNPKEFFRNYLSNFRDELLDWTRLVLKGEGEDWMNEYIMLFKNYIL